MDEKTTKLIKERYDALPESIKEVIISSNYQDALLAIGKQYNLNVEKLGKLEVETTLTMMGLTPTKNFESELTQELGLDKITGAKIVKDINDKIFLKIRTLLKIMNTPPGQEPDLSDDEEIKNTSAEHDIMKSAGIEILNHNEPLSKNLALEAKSDTHPILAQKLNDTMKLPSTRTEHTPENLSGHPTTPVQPATPATPSTPAKSGYTVDPYRMKPE